VCVCVCVCVLAHAQGHGLGGVLDFGFVDNNVVLGGFSGGSVALWDKRSSKAPKSVFSQGSGGVCHVQMLRDGHTLVGGTTGGTVQVWDIRKAVRNMSVMKMGGKDDLLLGCVKVDEQMPLLNAEGQVCVGRTMPPAEFGVHRAYAVEPIRESQVMNFLAYKLLPLLRSPPVIIIVVAIPSCKHFPDPSSYHSRTCPQPGNAGGHGDRDQECVRLESRAWKSIARLFLAEG
jgi:hypothetical protein